VHKLLNAADYGVPQRRERVVFVGFRSDIEAKWTFPAETHSLDTLLFEQFRTDDYWDRHKVAIMHRCFTERLSDRARRIADRPSRQPWRTVRDAIIGLTDPEFDPINSQSFHNHRFQPGARSYLGHTGSPLDAPAKTLKAGVHGVPGGENMLRLATGYTRYFTIRESARLPTFPDNYVLHGVWSEAMRQIGNAVPVTMAEVIAKSVQQHLHPHN
jgi:DNA (cytosine-5)-methyltransferase 1